MTNSVYAFVAAAVNAESDRAKKRINYEYELPLEEEYEISSLVARYEKIPASGEDYKLIGDKTVRTLHEYIDIVKLKITPEMMRQVCHLLFDKIVLSRGTISLEINSKVGDELKEIHIKYESLNRKVRADVYAAPAAGLNIIRNKTFQYVSMVQHGGLILNAIKSEMLLYLCKARFILNKTIIFC